ncbi:MAG: rRNA maturation RNase YbeY [Fibrobacteria bacterium]|nr:rRNA maturation RNase YbeY [Fibrobacteria bacterium]
MKPVCIENISNQSIPRLTQLEKLASTIMKLERPGPINLVFCTNSYIRKLNHQFRRLDKATDVLSFIYEEPEILGEIYISVEMARAQAIKWENTYYQELKRLIIHGCLHLAGYDHHSKKDRNHMRKKEEAYLFGKKLVYYGKS